MKYGRVTGLMLLFLALWPAAAHSQGDLVIEPSGHAFGQLAPGTSANGTLEVWNDGSQPLTLGAIGFVGDAGPFAVGTDGCVGGLVLDPGWGCDLDVSFVAPLPGGSYEAVLSVTAMETGEVATALLTGSSLIEGSLVAEPAFVDFGLVPRGVITPRRRVVIRNAGDTSITLINNGLRLAGPSGNDFTVPDRSCSGALAPGGTCAISVAFKAKFGSSPWGAPAEVVEGYLEIPVQRGSALAIPLRGAVPGVPDYSSVEWDLAELADALSGLMRGGPRRALRLPSFTAPDAGRLTLEVRGVAKQRHLRLAKGAIGLRAGQSGQLRFSLTRKARKLLRRPTKTIVRASVAFTPSATDEKFKQSVELTVRRPKPRKPR